MKTAYVAALLATVAAGAAQGADYPDRAVHIVVPWPAGGPSDAVARVIGQDMAAALHQPFVIDNKPGATGTIGSDFVAKAPADGYTIVVANTASHPLGRLANANLPYDPLKDFRPVIEYGVYPVGIMVAAALPIKTLREFVDYSKTTTDGLLVGVPGVNSVSHIYGQLLAQKTGAKLTFVPYRGDAPARVDLLAGNIHAIASTPDFGLIETGKARLIGETGSRRWPQAADVPTFVELGYPDLDGLIAWGFAAPAGTPDKVVATLNAAANRALKTEAVRKIMVDNAYFPTGGTPDAFWGRFKDQIRTFGDMEKSGIVKFQ